MAFVFSATYSSEAEVAAQAFYETLSEKDQRRYVAVEARRIGFGGIEYLASVFGCSRKTIERGLAELDELPNDPAAGRVRRPGGGRKKSRDGTPVGTEPVVAARRAHGGRPR